MTVISFSPYTILPVQIMNILTDIHNCQFLRDKAVLAKQRIVLLRHPFLLFSNSTTRITKVFLIIFKFSHIFFYQVFKFDIQIFFDRQSSVRYRFMQVSVQIGNDLNGKKLFYEKFNSIFDKSEKKTNRFQNFQQFQSIFFHVSMRVTKFCKSFAGRNLRLPGSDFRKNVAEFFMSFRQIKIRSHQHSHMVN